MRVVLVLLLCGLLAAPAAAAPGAELPRGGRALLPDLRVVGLYGHPQVPALGSLGQGSAAHVTERLRLLAARYERPGRRVQPALHLLASVAQPRGGRLLRRRTSPLLIERWLRVARAARALLVLEVQGGRSSFVAEARALRAFLREPDVGLALDPEWRVGPTGVPGRTRGAVGGREVDAVAAELQRHVGRGDLPDKLLVVHRFTEAMLRDEAALEARPGVDLVVDVDAIGSPPQKRRTYEALSARLPLLPHGLMLFARRDRGLMTPAQVLALSPEPDLVVLQ